jgi:hypothetical protein
VARPAPVPLPAPAAGPPPQLQAARRAFDAGRFADAERIAEGGLKLHPGDAALAALASEAHRMTATQAPRPAAGGAGNPRKAAARAASPYRQAWRAETIAKDLDAAENLYRRAIEEGDNTERAVRALAWLLHRLKRSTDALDLLNDYAPSVEDTQSHQNVTATIYKDIGNYEEAARVLERMVADQDQPPLQAGLLKRLIWTYRRTRDWERAKTASVRLLNIDPDNAEFADIAAELDRAEHGISSRLDELLRADALDVHDRYGSVSALLTFHLNQCEYKGVQPARLSAGQLGDRDIQELERLTTSLGVRRPGDRAEYNLSAARILRDLGRTDDERFGESLRYFAAAMGDFCVTERRPGEVTRAYYAEAVSLGGWDRLGELKVRQFILTFTERDWKLLADPPRFEKCLSMVLTAGPLRRPVLLGLLTLASGSDRVRHEIVNRTWNDKTLRHNLFQEICDYLEENSKAPNEDAFASAWSKALRQYRSDLEMQRQSLRSVLQRPDLLNTLAKDQQELEQLHEYGITPLDGERLRAVSDRVLGKLRTYLDQTAYMEQEWLEGLIQAEIRQQIADLERGPTALSMEYLVPLLERLRKALADHFARVQRAAEPTSLQVSLVLASPAHSPDTPVQVQLTVENLPRRSPAGDVKLQILENPADYTAKEKTLPVAHSLRDGEKQTCALSLQVTERSITDKVLTLRYRLEFTVRGGTQILTEPESISVTLYELKNWERTENPYALFAEGAAVEDPQLFYGRDPLLRTLVDSLARTQAKSVVLYGQKRAGKSSVLFHLQQRLEDNPQPRILAARFSMGQLGDSPGDSGFLFKIARSFYERFEKLADSGAYPMLAVDEPGFADFAGAPEIVFDEYMSRMRRQMRLSEDFRDWRLVVLIDEFTIAYAAIQRGHLSRGFMKLWKAILEKGLFSSVLVGNDLMPAFLEVFPNEFQVARQERVSYLDRPDAIGLITEPVKTPDGESLYRGESVARILELTARSPYYIQLFCNRLIEHMNAERKVLVGPADVDEVADMLVRGDKSLTVTQFDNLLTPGDADVSKLRQEVVLEVLHTCLTGRRGDLYLDGRKADTVTDGRRVLDDLEEREVIVRDAEERYRIKVGLFAEWLWDRQR